MINWVLIFEIVYVLLIILVCLRVIYETRTNTKAVAYLLLVIFVPLLGMLIYFAFGANYRKRKLYNRKLTADEAQSRQLRDTILNYSRTTYLDSGDAVRRNRGLAFMLAHNSMSALSSGNAVRLLINGEEKFPEVLKALEHARHHIHIAYYIFEDDGIGQAIESMLIRKVQEGVVVRLMVDDFGSRGIRKTMTKRLKAAGVQVFPFYRIRFISLANRINYRNHRKIIVIDGMTGFVGGINVSDKYINKKGEDVSALYWRDTHLRIDGPGVFYLQRIFMADWNFCAGDTLRVHQDYFPELQKGPAKGDKIVQISASGPDSDRPTILFSILQAINHAREEVLISTPYFIPGESIIDALCIAALGGVSVKLLVPGVSDSLFVNAAARSYYEELLDSGVEIYRYKKGFIHAKTMVTDRKLAMVGTANMDYRSFELNFEVNAFVYDEETAEELATVFHRDLAVSERIDPLLWQQRPWYKKLFEKTVRLIAPLL